MNDKRIRSAGVAFSCPSSKGLAKPAVESNILSAARFEDMQAAFVKFDPIADY